MAKLKETKEVPSDKRCSRCRIIKPLDDFLPCKTGKYGLYNYCTDCHKAYQLNRNPNRATIDDKQARHVGLKKLGLKTCSSCKLIKPYGEFYGDPRHSDGKQSHCIECCNQAQDKYYLRREYGLTIEQIEQLMDFQDGRCAICRRTPKKNKFNIDHCHFTHRVRALLCVNCNTNLLPYVEQFPEWVAKAIEYLKDPPAFDVIGEVFVPETNQSRVKERNKALAKDLVPTTENNSLLGATT